MKPKPRITPAAAGFSLIELMIVIGILAVLSAFMYSSISGRHQRTQMELCSDNLLKLYVSLQIYANDFKGALPVNTNAQTSEAVLDALVPRYTADTTIFICPGSHDWPIPSGESIRQHRISYAYYMGRRLDTPPAALMSDRQVNTAWKTNGDFAFSPDGKPPGNNHYKFGGNFLFCDGSVQSSSAQLNFAIPPTPGVVLLNPKP